MPDGHGGDLMMKKISLSEEIEVTPAWTRWRRPKPLSRMAVLGLAVILPTACSDELSCAETATCPSSVGDGGSDVETGSREGSADRQDSSDRSATDIRV